MRALITPRFKRLRSRSTFVPHPGQAAHSLARGCRPRQAFYPRRTQQDVTPRAPLRVTNSDALVAPLLAGVALAELPEFIAAHYLADGRLERVLPAWSMTQGGLYFVTPSARSRPRKVQALADFFVERLSAAAWRGPRAEG